MIKQTHEMPDIPAALRRQTNAKGVTLSAGVAKPVVATGAKRERKSLTAARMVAAANSKPAKEAVAPALGTEPKMSTKKEIANHITETKRALRASAKAAKEAAPKAVKAKAVKLPKSTPVTAAPALDADGNPLEKVPRSIVPMKFKARYAANAGTCGDDMALELKAATTTRNADKREVLDVEALWAIAKANTIDVAKYVDLNNGQKRMNVGNKLRGRLAAGEDVIIGKRKFKAEDFQPRH